ncbi:nicotinamide mononucleotide transporter [Leeia sp. IMCC25680]|uniref:Nicotinamide riboside transporter PnuC n=2 Tax=Leeia aquatica TaxID=2725557 RepID=A0A847SC43_9NEIS|nr:nicotinamide mononucleotide transporter [Leeia aquatica]
MSPLEIAANLLYLVSVWLAAQNRVHTWWTGIIACALFATLFYQSQLYADVVLQGFFIVTSLWGWWQWRGGIQRVEPPIRRVPIRMMLMLAVFAGGVTYGYGMILHRYTNAYAPFWDSAILALSVLGQFLLMARRVESWLCWILVNTIAIPVYASRGLQLTAAVYVLFWFNAWYGGWRWHRQAER